MYKRDTAWLALRNRGLAFFDTRPAGLGAIQERGGVTQGLGAAVAGHRVKRRVDVAEFPLRRIAIEVNERDRRGHELPHWLYENVQAHQSHSLVRRVVSKQCASRRRTPCVSNDRPGVLETVGAPLRLASLGNLLRSICSYIICSLQRHMMFSRDKSSAAKRRSA